MFQGMKFWSSLAQWRACWGKSRVAASAGLAMALMGGCGGGGGALGGGGTPPADPADGNSNNGWLTFTPSPLVLTNYAGDTKLFSITANSSKVIEGVFNVGIIDSKGVTTGKVELLPTSSTTYVANLQLSQKLAEGVFEGGFEVRLCRDDPQVCAQPVPGSPWQVPYKLSVLKSNSLSPLVPLAGAFGWSTYQGDAARTGVVNADISAANFNRRWVVPNGLYGVLTDAGRILGRSGAGIAAFSEFDGSKTWGRGDSGASERDWYSSLAARNGRLWVIAQGYDRQSSQFDAQLVSYDVATGSIRSEVRLEAPPPTVSGGIPVVASPVIESGAVFSGTVSGTMRRNSESDGFGVWKVTPSTEQSPPDRRGLPVSVANGRVVGFDGHRLWAVDSGSGAALFSIKAEGGGSLAYRGEPPVLAAGEMAYVTTYFHNGLASAGGRLIAFDLATRRQRWAIEPLISSSAVEKSGIVYVIDGGNSLLALDSASGGELWRWLPPAPVAAAPSSGKSLLIVGNYAFAAIGEVTYAIDLDTRKTAWQYPMAGSLAVTSNGTLLISTGGEMVAINLR